MANNSFFTRNESNIPMKPDSNIVRVDMETMEIGGRKTALPSMTKSDVGGISHVPNRDRG